MKVKVYFNLHNFKWSIKCAKTGLVVGHASGVILKDVTQAVSQAGRERVLREKKKNVHAYLVGELIHVSEFTSFRDRNYSIESTLGVDGCPFFIHEITYNPYKYDCFVMKQNDTMKVEHAKFVEMTGDKRVFASGITGVLREKSLCAA